MAIKVFFNNSCNVCRLEINHYKKIADSNLEWIDITNNDEALKITSKSQEELLRRLHVIDDGKVIGGAKAFIIIWSKIPKYNFLGISSGDRWCLCAERWKQAYFANKAPKVILESTNILTLSVIKFNLLKKFSYQ